MSDFRSLLWFSLIPQANKLYTSTTKIITNIVPDEDLTGQNIALFGKKILEQQFQCADIISLYSSIIFLSCTWGQIGFWMCTPYLYFYSNKLYSTTTN